MRKYLKIYLGLIRTGFIADMEFRANFLIRFVADLFWYSAQIISFEVLYQYTTTIGTWKIEQTRVFLGILFVVDSFYMIFFHDNLDHLSEKVRKGELDLLLTKPINSQFMVSLQRVLVSQISCFIVSLLWLIWAISRLNDFSYLKLAWLIILIPAGLVSLYAVRFIISASAVIFTKSDNLQFIWYQIYKLGMRPDQIYNQWLRLIILSAIPVAFIASVPTDILFSEINYTKLAWVIGWSAFLLWLSHRFWNFALKYYQSASS